MKEETSPQIPAKSSSLWWRETRNDLMWALERNRFQSCEIIFARAFRWEGSLSRERERPFTPQSSLPNFVWLFAGNKIYISPSLGTLQYNKNLSPCDTHHLAEWHNSHAEFSPQGKKRESARENTQKAQKEKRRSYISYSSFSPPVSTLRAACETACSERPPFLGARP